MKLNNDCFIFFHSTKRFSQIFFYSFFLEWYNFYLTNKQQGQTLDWRWLFEFFGSKKLTASFLLRTFPTWIVFFLLIVWWNWKICQNHSLWPNRHELFGNTQNDKWFAVELWITEMDDEKLKKKIERNFSISSMIQQHYLSGALYSLLTLDLHAEYMPKLKGKFVSVVKLWLKWLSYLNVYTWSKSTWQNSKYLGKSFELYVDFAAVEICKSLNI